MKDSRENSADPSTGEAAFKPPLTLLQEQSDRIAELILASARQLATDPKHLAEIKKLLF
jgi:hypothetical protein